MRRRTAPIHEAFQSNYIASVGPMVDAFEHEFAERVGICSALAYPVTRRAFSFLFDDGTFWTIDYFANGNKSFPKGRLEVKNPGMLPFGMTMEDFKAGVSKIRNRVIARVFREMGLMEEWGSGYKRVIHACQSGGYPEPDWQEHGTAFRVIFYPNPAVLEPSRADVPVNVPVDVPVNNRQQYLFCPTGLTGL